MAAELTARGITMTQFEGEERRLVKILRDNLESLERRIAEAQAALSEGRTPNSCGVVQSLGLEIDRGVGQLYQLRDVLGKLRAAETYDRNHPQDQDAHCRIHKIFERACDDCLLAYAKKTIDKEDR